MSLLTSHNPLLAFDNFRENVLLRFLPWHCLLCLYGLTSDIECLKGRQDVPKPMGLKSGRMTVRTELPVLTSQEERMAQTAQVH